MPARMPWCSDSAPSVGLTVCTCSRVSSTGRAPAFSTVARSRASASVNPPVISPVPPVIAPCTLGEEMMTRSTTIAIWFWARGSETAAVVASANRSDAVAGELERHRPFRRRSAPPRMALDSASHRPRSRPARAGTCCPPRPRTRPPGPRGPRTEHALVWRSSSVGHVTCVVAYEGSFGGTIASTGRSSSRAVCPITSSRRCCPVERCRSSAEARSMKQPRFSSAELTTQ